jgi:hypothetical protein
VGTFCPATISPVDGPIIILDEDELDCYEPQGVIASDVLVSILCGLLVVAGTAIMYLFGLSRGAMALIKVVLLGSLPPFILLAAPTPLSSVEGG